MTKAIAFAKQQKKVHVSRNTKNFQSIELSRTNIKPDGSMKYICALIAVSDMKRSRNFYENLLGQTVKYDFGENVTFHGDFAIHLQSHFKELIDNREIKAGGNSFELYFEYDNVDEIVGLLKENSVPLVHEIREQPWRQKVVRCYDPDSHIVEIGESIEYLAYRLSKEGLPIDEIAQTTNMPIDFVMASVAKYEV